MDFSEKTRHNKQSIYRWVWILGIFLLFLLFLSIMRSDPSIDSEETTPTDGAPKGCVRVLVAARDRTSGLSDVMMLLSLDQDRGMLSVLQIPRDTYANFENGSYRKINGAPTALGGMRAFCDRMEEALGVSIDHYVRLGAESFQKGVDALGGVEITLPESMDYEDPAQGLSIHLKEGKQTLNGQEAEWFVRYRADYLQGDLGRLDAQKLFLAALLREALDGRSPMKLVRLATAMLADVETDLGFSDILMLSGAAMELSSERILFVTAPGSDVRGKNGGSYYVLSAKAMDELLRSHFGKEEEGFDPVGYFLNGDNPQFREIYESDCFYRIFSAEEIGKEGPSIPRT